MNLSTILSLLQRPTAILLILTTAVFGTPLNLFAQAPSPVQTNETGDAVPTMTLEQSEEEGITPGEEPPASEEEPLELSLQQSTVILSPVTDEPDVIFQLKTSKTDGEEKRNRTEKSSVVDEDGNRIETAQKYEGGVLKREITRTYSKEGDLTTEERKRLAKSGRPLSLTVTEYDADGNRVSRQRDEYVYGGENNEQIIEIIRTIDTWKNGKRTRERMRVSPDGSKKIVDPKTPGTGGPLPLAVSPEMLDQAKKILGDKVFGGTLTPAPKDLPDAGSTATFYDSEGNIVGRFDFGFYPMEGEPDTVWYKYENGKYVKIEEKKKPTSIPATDVMLADAKQILGDAVASGVTTPAPENLPDAGSTTIFYDAEGNIVGRLDFGFYPMEGEPDTVWYKYENGEYVKIEEKKPTTIPATDVMLADAKQILGDTVSSGVTTPAPENLPDAGSTTIFYDAEGNIVGKLHSGFMPMEGEPDTVWYKYENGEYVKIEEKKPTTIPATDVMLADAKQILGDTVSSGVTTPAPENLPDAGSTTIFYDAEGNIVGKLHSGFFPPEGEPDTVWYKYENGEYVKIPQTVPATDAMLADAKKVLGDQVVSGQTTLAPANIADGGVTTIFYDKDGNIVGRLDSGFMPMEGEPDTVWYKYENGNYKPVLGVYSDGRQVLYIYGEGYETALEMDVDGNFISATKTYDDGKIETFDHLQKMMVSQTTCSADGKECSTIAASMKFDPDAVQLGTQTVSTVLPDGSKQTTTFMFTGYLVESKGTSVTQAQLDKASDILGVSITSGIVIKPDANTADAPTVTQFFDANGTLVGEFSINGFAPDVLPSTWSLIDKDGKRTPVLDVYSDGREVLHFYGEGYETALEMDADGKLLSAVRTYADGKVETFDHLQKMFLDSTTCSADGKSCESIAAGISYDPNAVQLGTQTVSTILADGSKQTTTFMFTGYLAETKNPDGSTVTYIYGDNYALAVAMSADGDVVTSAVLTSGNSKLDVTGVYTLLEKEGAEGISKLLADLEDLTTRLGMSGLNIKVTNFEQVTWSDGCVGWYVEGMACTKALVTGYSTTFEIEGISFEYHAGGLDPQMVAILEEVADLPESEKLAKIKELVAALPVPETKINNEKLVTEKPATDALLNAAIRVLGGTVKSGTTTLADPNVEGSTDVTVFFDATGTPLGKVVSSEPPAWYRYDESGEYVAISQAALLSIFGSPVSAAVLAQAQEILGSNVVRGEISTGPNGDGYRFYDSSGRLIGIRVTAASDGSDYWNYRDLVTDELTLAQRLATADEIAAAKMWLGLSGSDVITGVVRFPKPGSGNTLNTAIYYDANGQIIGRNEYDLQASPQINVWYRKYADGVIRIHQRNLTPAEIAEAFTVFGIQLTSGYIQYSYNFTGTTLNFTATNSWFLDSVGVIGTHYSDNNISNPRDEWSIAIQQTNGYYYSQIRRLATSAELDQAKTALGLATTPAKGIVELPRFDAKDKTIRISYYDDSTPPVLIGVRSITATTDSWGTVANGEMTNVSTATPVAGLVDAMLLYKSTALIGYVTSAARATQTVTEFCNVADSGCLSGTIVNGHISGYIGRRVTQFLTTYTPPYPYVDDWYLALGGTVPDKLIRRLATSAERSEAMNGGFLATQPYFGVVDLQTDMIITNFYDSDNNRIGRRQTYNHPTNPSFSSDYYFVVVNSRQETTTGRLATAAENAEAAALFGVPVAKGVVRLPVPGSPFSGYTTDTRYNFYSSSNELIGWHTVQKLSNVTPADYVEQWYLGGLQSAFLIRSIESEADRVSAAAILGTTVSTKGVTDYPRPGSANRNIITSYFNGTQRVGYRISNDAVDAAWLSVDASGNEAYLSNKTVVSPYVRGVLAAIVGGVTIADTITLVSSIADLKIGKARVEIRRSGVLKGYFELDNSVSPSSEKVYALNAAGTGFDLIRRSATAAEITEASGIFSGDATVPNLSRGITLIPQDGGAVTTYFFQPAYDLLQIAPSGFNTYASAKHVVNPSTGVETWYKLVPVEGVLTWVEVRSIVVV